MEGGFQMKKIKISDRKKGDLILFKPEYTKNFTKNDKRWVFLKVSQMDRKSGNFSFYFGDVTCFKNMEIKWFVKFLLKLWQPYKLTSREAEKYEKLLILKELEK